MVKVSLHALLIISEFISELRIIVDKIITFNSFSVSLKGAICDNPVRDFV